jgi:hypothetical protein
VITHSPKGSGATVGTNRIGVPRSTIMKNKTIKPQQRQHVSTAYEVRLVRGKLDGTPLPRSHSDSYEAPPTGTPRLRPVPYKAHTKRHLDCIPTRTRLAWLPAKLQLTRPRVRTLDPLHSPTLRQKSEHSMRLPATIYRHGHSHDRRGSSASVSPHFFTAHPVMGGETYHCAHLTTHCFITNHPRGRIRQGPYSTISEIRPYPSGLDPASTRPRRPAMVDRKERPTWHRTPGHFTVSSPNVTTVSRDGRPFLEHAATATSTGIDKTSLQGTPVPRPPLTL